MGPRLRASFALLSLALAGCSSAFSTAMQRGATYMEAGMYDRASAEFAQAVRLEPDDATARVKLQTARRLQAEQMMSRAVVIAARQDFEQALRLARDAVAMQPEHLVLQRSLSNIVEAAVAYASFTADRGDSSRALSLARLVLTVAPQHRAAQLIADRVNHRIATERFARATAFFSRQLPGNAMVELAACLHHERAFPGAAEKLNEAYRSMREQLTIQLSTRSKPSNELSFADLITTASLRVAFPPAWPIELQENVGPSTDLVVEGGEVAMLFDRDRRTVLRSCEYVCGTDHRPNPDHDRAERDVADMERNLDRAERGAAELERDVSRQQREVDEAEKDVTRAEAELDSARSALAGCEASHGPGKCQAERGRVESEQRDLGQARRRLESPRDRLRDARERWVRARDSVHEARQQRSSALERMRSTPRMIATDRVCTHSYDMVEHERSGRLSVDFALRDHGAGRDVVRFQPRVFATARRWQTYLPQPGRCPDVGKGAPASPPGEAELRSDLQAQLLAEVVSHVRDLVASRFESLRTDAAKAEAEGRIDDAVESSVRFLVAGGESANAEAVREIDARLHRTRGVEGIRVLLPR